MYTQLFEAATILRCIIMAKQNLVSPTSQLLTDLIQRGQVFCASQSATDGHSSAHCQANKLSSASRQHIATGFAGLDHALGGGLALGKLHEFQRPADFYGDSQLVQAAVAYANSAPVFWLNPPAQPFVPGLQHAAEHYVLDQLSDEEIKWASSQIISNLGHGVVLLWHPQPDVQTVRSWQRAMQQAPEALVLVFSGLMPQEARAYHTRVRVRLHAATSASSSIAFDVLKRPGGWPVSLDAEKLAVHR